MPSGRPQRKAAVEARQKLAETGAGKPRGQQQGAAAEAKEPDTAQKAKSPEGNNRTGLTPKTAAAQAKAREAAMKKEEGQTDRDKHTPQEKKEEEGSTAPLPDKVCYSY
jgi:hypothetical protein